MNALEEKSSESPEVHFLAGVADSDIHQEAWGVMTTPAPVTTQAVSPETDSLTPDQAAVAGNDSFKRKEPWAGPAG